MASPEIKIGLIVNPIAGMGGRVALKGTDGKAALSAAIARGAVPEANEKAERALKILLPHEEKILIVTASGPMGEDLCRKLKLPYLLVYSAQSAETTARDTESAACRMLEKGVDLLLFAGGDGTARNICTAVGEQIPVIGIPAGVKIQSAVFALSPENAGMIAAEIAQGAEMSLSKREVVDLNEDDYRLGRVSARLYGMMDVPNVPQRLQSMKQSGFASEADQIGAIGAYLQDHMEQDVYYAVGSGSCAKCLSRELGIDYELLGVDVIRNGRLVQKDATEQQLWQYAQEGDMRIIVSPIGGQGFIFGRGNHQFSARILRMVGKERIQIISPQSKILSIADHTLHVDCGDEEVNQSLRGFYRVLSAYGYFSVLECR